MAFELDLPISSSPQQAGLLNSMHGAARTSRDVAVLSAAFGGHAFQQRAVQYGDIARTADSPARPIGSQASGVAPARQ